MGANDLGRSHPRRNGDVRPRRALAFALAALALATLLAACASSSEPSSEPSSESSPQVEPSGGGTSMAATQPEQPVLRPDEVADLLLSTPVEDGDYLEPGMPFVPGTDMPPVEGQVAHIALPGGAVQYLVIDGSAEATYETIANNLSQEEQVEEVEVPGADAAMCIDSVEAMCWALVDVTIVTARHESSVSDAIQMLGEGVAHYETVTG